MSLPVSKQRYNRLAQQKHRGGPLSPKTDLENLRILLAREAEELTEGQVMTALGQDRLSVRLLREAEIARGITLAVELKKEVPSA